MGQNFTQTLIEYQKSFGNIIEYDLKSENVKKLDLSSGNSSLKNLDWTDPEKVENFIYDDLLKDKIGVGGYNEERSIYKYYKPFQDLDQPRNIHIGVDIWSKPTTKVFAPLSGELHSYSNNKESGNYGPTIILKHKLEDYEFYTLFGHLSETSLIGLPAQSKFGKNDIIGEIGDMNENGNWPAHLHFQIIYGVEPSGGDFPGVVSKKNRDLYLNHCPDPNLILNTEVLK